MFSTTIMEIPKHFQEAMIFRNYFFMVKSTVVQPPLLARLATVSVCRAGGKPSTWFPPGTRRAVRNIQKLIFEVPFFEPLELKNQKPLKFHANFKIFENSSSFSNIFMRDTVQTKFAISDEFVLSVCWEFESFNKADLLRNL